MNIQLHKQTQLLIQTPANITKIAVSGRRGVSLDRVMAISTVALRRKGIIVELSGVVDRELTRFAGSCELASAERAAIILHQALQDEAALVAKLAKEHGQQQKIVLLSANGVPDIQTVLHVPYFAKALADANFSLDDVCDGMYHGMMHLPDLDNMHHPLVDEAWKSHRHRRHILAPSTVCYASKTFDAELAFALVDEILAIVGDPIPIENEEKFLLHGFDPAATSIPVAGALIVQHYLKSDKESGSRRVRMRSAGGGETYYLNTKRARLDIGPGANEEVEYVISKESYLSLLPERDPECCPVEKMRYSFFWLGQLFEVDVFMGKHAPLVMAELELTNKAQTYSLPPFFTDSTCVTGNKKYSNRSLSRLQEK